MSEAGECGKRRRKMIDGYRGSVDVVVVVPPSSPPSTQKKEPGEAENKNRLYFKDLCSAQVYVQGNLLQ